MLPIVSLAVYFLLTAYVSEPHFDCIFAIFFYTFFNFYMQANNSHNKNHVHLKLFHYCVPTRLYSYGKTKSNSC